MQDTDLTFSGHSTGSTVAVPGIARCNGHGSLFNMQGSYGSVVVARDSPLLDR
jgi:hypothetical protein